MKKEENHEINIEKIRRELKEKDPQRWNEIQELSKIISKSMSKNNEIFSALKNSSLLTNFEIYNHAIRHSLLNLMPVYKQIAESFSLLEKWREKYYEDYQPHLYTLKKEFVDGENALILGAGASIEAGIPNWADLINKMLISSFSDHFEDEKYQVSSGGWTKIIHHLSNNDLLFEASLLRSIMPDHLEFNKILHDALYQDYNPNIKQSTALLISIKQICYDNPQIKILTFNYDNLLENILERNNIKYHSINCMDVDSLNSSKPGCVNIYHLHGYVPYNEPVTNTPVILSREDYSSLMNGEFKRTNTVINDTLYEKTSLIVGLSLSDVNFNRIIQGCNASSIIKTQYFFSLSPRRYEFFGGLFEDIKEIEDEDIFDIFGILRDYEELMFQCLEKLNLKTVYFLDYNDIPKILDTL